MNLVRVSTVNVALMNAVGDLARSEHPAERESLTQAVNQLARAYTARTRSRGLAMARTKASLCKMFRLGHRGDVTQAGSGETLAKPLPALTNDRNLPMEYCAAPSGRLILPTGHKAQT